MSPQRAAFLAPILLAFSQGKTVQSRAYPTSVWIDALSPSFSEAYEWRIKPEPREFVLEMTSDGWVAVSTNARREYLGYTVRVREITD